MAIPEWIHLNKTTGASEVFTNITISADTNTGTTSRSYTLTITGGTPGDIATATIEVVQSASSIIRPLTFNVNSNGYVQWIKDRTFDYLPNTTISYRKNGGNWNTITSSTAGTYFLVNAGDVVEFIGDNLAYGTNHSYFSTPVSFTVEGNIMSLMDSSNYSTLDVLTGDANFYGLFDGCSGLTDASNLKIPATALTMYCYSNMFADCASLTGVPELPATTLAGSCYSGMFYRCTSLTTAPDLPATTLAPSCYAGMFHGCTNLIEAPELPVTTLTIGCYTSMFSGCTSLTEAPELPATTMAQYCYKAMFKDCTSLTTPPALPATSFTGTDIHDLGESLYESMFEGCTSLTEAPALPATEISDACYQAMFKGCTSLTTAPELPATTAEGYCYKEMFRGCTGLTTAPSVLPATVFESFCYESMFRDCTSLTKAPDMIYGVGGAAYMFLGCSNLNYIRCLSESSSSTKVINNWVSGVSVTGTFIRNQFAKWSIGNSGIPTTWEVYREYDLKPMTFKIISGGTINWSHRRTLIDDVGDKTIEYRINDGNWTSITSSSAGSSFNVSTGDIVEFRGDNTRYGSLPLSYNTFSGTTATFEAYGNTMSLINSTGYTGVTDLTEQYAFNRLFAGCTGLTTAKYLVLPTTTLPMHVYSSMFEGCTRLKDTPELPAATLTNSCYNEMFSGCNSLQAIRCLATDISAYNCTYNWVSNVSILGRFYKDPSMTGWGSGNSGIPNDWIVEDA